MLTTCLVAAAVHNPTNPDSAADVNNSAASSVVAAVDPSLAHPTPLGNNATTGANATLGAGATLGGAGGGMGMGMGESSYEVFDPLNWMLDGLVDFPYFGAQGGLETGGIA